MDVVTFVEPHLQPSELMHQGLGLFHDQRMIPSPLPCSVLRLARNGLIPRSRSSSRCGSLS